MRLSEILSAPNAVSSLDTQQRHEWLRFIYTWLSGSLMRDNNTPAILEKWREFSKIFPTKLAGQKKLYRLVTLPISYADKSQDFDISPSPWSVSSWSSNLRGIDCVEGVSLDQYGESHIHSTTRMAIEARIECRDILADYRTIRRAVVALSHDYFEKFPEQEIVIHKNGCIIHSSKAHPEYPGGDDQFFDINEVGFMQDVVANQPGGWYRQYEYIVETPKIVKANIARVYRVGSKRVRWGNDDPHN